MVCVCLCVCVCAVTDIQYDEGCANSGNDSGCGEAEIQNAIFSHWKGRCCLVAGMKKDMIWSIQDIKLGSISIILQTRMLFSGFWWNIYFPSV